MVIAALPGASTRGVRDTTGVDAADAGVVTPRGSQAAAHTVIAAIVRTRADLLTSCISRS
jgi:hypothetical protein